MSKVSSIISFDFDWIFSFFSRLIDFFKVQAINPIFLQVDHSVSYFFITDLITGFENVNVSV